MNAMWMPVREFAAIVYPRRPTLLRWGLHLAFWSLLLALLWQLNRWGDLDRLLRSPWPILHRIWLPLLAATLYPLGWLGVGLWHSLRQEACTSAWPEVESAWYDAADALEAAGISARTAPIFLVVGQSTAEAQGLWAALGVTSVSSRPGAAIQVFTGSQTVFVGCAARTVSAAGDPEQTALYDLCRLLRHERAPRHPVQGVIVAVRFAADQSASSFRDLLTTCRNELHAIRQGTGLEVPTYFAVSGLDHPAGASPEWLQRFPPLPDLDPAEFASMYRLGLDWLFLERIAQHVRPLLQCTPDALADNIRLYRWLSAAQGWRARLRKLLSEATQTQDAEPGMVAGCYVLPAGPADSIARTLVEDLHKHRETACWTAETAQEHVAQARRVRIGYIVGAIGMAAMILGAVAIWACR